MKPQSAESSRPSIGRCFVQSCQKPVQHIGRFVSLPHSASRRPTPTTTSAPVIRSVSPAPAPAPGRPEDFPRNVVHAHSRPLGLRQKSPVLWHGATPGLCRGRPTANTNRGVYHGYAHTRIASCLKVPAYPLTYPPACLPCLQRRVATWLGS